jgi:hypothetical protein
MSGTLPTVYAFTGNIADAEAPKPLPVGEYRGVVRLVEPKVSKASGKPMMDVTYVISAEQYPADYTDGNPDGTPLHVYQSLDDNPRNRYQLRKFCELHGVVASNRINLPDFMGTEVILRIEHEDYQGIPQARATPVREV